MSKDVPVSALKTVRDVLEYFLQNPSAADSLEGIARWRVQQDAVPHIVQQVDQALSWLVERHLLVREDRIGVAPTFRLNPTRAAEAEQLLHDIERQGVPARTLHGDDLQGVTERDEADHPSELTTKALTWLDAVLRRYHRGEQRSGADLPGLTRSAASVDSALAPRVIESPPGSRQTDDDVDRAAGELAAARDSAPRSEPLAALYRNLGLTPLEFHSVLLCLAPELDVKYQLVFGVLNDDLGRRTTTLGLVSAVLGDPQAVRYQLARSAGLTQWGLLEHGTTFPYADQALRLDAPLVAWLTGDEQALLRDARIAPALRSDTVQDANWIAPAVGEGVVQGLTEALIAHPGTRWLVLSGRDVDGSRVAIDVAAREARRTLVRLALSRVAQADADARDIVRRATRAAQLLDAILVVDVGTDSAAREAIGVLALLVDAFEHATALGILVVPDVQDVVSVLPPAQVRVLRREPIETEAIVATLSGAAAVAELRIRKDEIERLAMAFPLPIAALGDAVRLAVLEGAAHLDPPGQVAALGAALRRVASPDLPRFARAVEPTFDLHDVILPSDRHRQLHEMVAHVRHAYQVLHTWGFDAQLSYGRGVTALFCGPSGTGKTMAAQAIARELGTYAYIVDLSRVLSKYIGATEANLDSVFNDAERAGAVLLFDEADALFGKRSEVKDSHDRYANIEVAYLLQRMEAFTGLAILTTNLRRNLDEAFTRRLRFIVEFPFPGAQAREAIWRFCLPDTAPLAGDINLRLLARRLELTGGSIRQITVRAAFAAAADNANAIAMRHVIAAARAELLKLGMASAERELSELEAATERPRSHVA